MSRVAVGYRNDYGLLAVLGVLSFIFVEAQGMKVPIAGPRSDHNKE